MNRNLLLYGVSGRIEHGDGTVEILDIEKIGAQLMETAEDREKYLNHLERSGITYWGE